MLASIARVRTFFASFHTSPPAQAREILGDALQKRQRIGDFEFAERKLLENGLPLLPPPALALCGVSLSRERVARQSSWTTEPGERSPRNRKGEVKTSPVPFPSLTFQPEFGKWKPLCLAVTTRVAVITTTVVVPN